MASSAVSAADGDDVTRGHVTSSWERLGASRRPGGARGGKTPPLPVQHYNTFNDPFFWTIRSPRRQYFIIHPEWASEKHVPWHSSSSSSSSSPSSSSRGVAPVSGPPGGT